MREFEFNAELQEMQEKSTEKLRKDVEAKRSQLEQWSSTAYGEVSLFLEILHHAEIPHKYNKSKTPGKSAY